ncbi:MAG: hypothetical protein LUI01_01970 [Firmicutes bacterium]|nr:hypothetical protein [Bacillota bacterium]
MYQVHIGKKHIAAIALCLAMLFTYSSSAFAADVFGTFSGSITSEDDVDLSGIEIEVYTAVPVYDTEDTDEVLYYGETYDFSVYTDADGSFEFDKPTEYCSISVVLDTLPANYGVSQEVQFIAPSRTSVEITMSAIASAEARLESGNISVEFYNSDGDTVLCSYSVTPSSDADTSSGAAGSVTAYSSLGAIDSMTSYIHSGTIETGTLSFSYSVSEDISDYSVIDKINYLYEQGDITEEEKIIYYCDLASPSCEIEFELECGNVLYDEITAYADSTDEISDEVSAAIAEATNDDPPSYTDYVLAQTGSYHFKIYYDPSEGMTASVAEKVADEVESICSYFVITNGFNAVKMMDTSTYYYLIYLVPDDYMSASGRTIYTYNSSTNRTTGSSYICLLYSRVKDDDYAVTLAHEFMHAIMVTYSVFSGNSSKWFRESFASMSGLVYYDEYTSWYDNDVSNYLANCYRSIYTSISYMYYGSLVYPLYIYEYLGGWSAIKSIYNELAAADTVYDAITNSSYVSSNKIAFREMAKRNYYPKEFYNYASENWCTTNINKNRELKTYTDLAILPMACQYQQYSSTTNLGTLTCTIEVTSDSYSGLYLCAIEETSSGTISFSNINSNFDKTTYTVSNFGSSVQKLTLLFVNVNTSGSSLIYNMTAST